MHVPSQLARALATVVLLAGCGISDPYAQQHAAEPSTSRTRPAAQTAEIPDHDGPAPVPAPPAAPSAYSPTPAAALARYARLYLNWSWATVASAQRQLATISQGQARAQALAGARKPPAQVRRYQVQNAGELAATARGEGPESGKWAVVADERTTGTGPYEGLPAISEVIWATVARGPQGWIVTGWYPAGATP
jgi:hypothetical protein